MKKLSKIDESAWGEMRRRSSGEQTRKEDEIGNIKTLKPLDMGGSVLWADEDLEVDGEYLFTFHEAFELVKNSEWRLPTLKEVAELDILFNRKLYFYDEDSFYFKYGDNQLIFYKRGFIHRSSRDNMISDEDFYYGWTADEYENGSAHILTFDFEKIIHSPVNSRSVVDQVVEGEDDRLCVRLVKDK